MNLTQYSRNRILDTFKKWDVPKDFAEPMYNYLVYGWSPGSCFTAVLANDFYKAMQSSHPANTVNAFKSVVGWLTDHMPHEAFGSYDAVNTWAIKESSERRAILEQHNLIFTAKEETWQALKGLSTDEPVLY